MSLFVLYTKTVGSKVLTCTLREVTRVDLKSGSHSVEADSLPLHFRESASNLLASAAASPRGSERSRDPIFDRDGLRRLGPPRCGRALRNRLFFECPRFRSIAKQISALLCEACPSLVKILVISASVAYRPLRPQRYIAVYC